MSKVAKNSYILYLLIITVTLFCFSCTEDTARPPEHPRLSYTMRLNALHPDSLQLSMTAHEIPGANGKFILPAHHFDNPLDSFSSSTIKNLIIRDADGQLAAHTISKEQIGPKTNQILTVSENVKYPLTFTYTFNSSAIAEHNMFLPSMHLEEESALLMGSYLFIIPCLSHNLARLWRSPINIELQILTPASVDFKGIGPYSTYRNIYELLFTQITVGAPEIGRGTLKEQEFIVLNLSGDKYDNSYTPRIINSIPRLVKETNRYFGNIRSQDSPFTITITGTSGALEGYNGFTVLPPTPDNESEIFMIFAHEIIHHFVGIRCGDYDDPWWKEGMTNYLGVVLSARLGYYSKESVRNMILSTRDFSDPIYSHCLSDPHVRSHHFKELFHQLIYVKGMWVSMLMDERIRRATDNTVILDEVMGELCLEFDGSAFHRQDIVDIFGKYNTDVSDIFSDYVDTQDSIPYSRLEKAYTFLDSMGAFGESAAVSFTAGEKTESVAIEVY